jgi:hypothetical protein
MGVALAALLGAACLAAPAEAVDVGQQAPEIQATEWLGEAYPGGLASLEGKVVLLDFWGLG